MEMKIEIFINTKKKVDGRGKSMNSRGNNKNQYIENIELSIIGMLVKDNNEFEILLKNQNILNEKISALISSNMNIMTSIETIKNNILTILNKMNTLSSKLSDIEVRLQMLDKDDNINNEIESVRQQISSLKEEINQMLIYNS